MALNRPAPVPPVPVDFKAAKPRPVILKLDTNPEPGLVRVQFLKLDGTAIKPEFKPADTISAPVTERGKTDSSKSEMQIILQEKKAEKDPRGFPVIIRMAVSAPGGKFTLRVDPFFEGQDSSVRPLRVNEVEASMLFFKDAQARADAALKANQKGLNKEQTQAQSRDAKLAAEHLAALFGFAQSLTAAKIHYRVYLDVEGQQLELASTEVAGAEPAKPAAPEPSGADLNLDDDKNAPKRFFSGDKKDDKREPPKK